MQPLSHSMQYLTNVSHALSLTPPPPSSRSAQFSLLEMVDDGTRHSQNAHRHQDGAHKENFAVVFVIFERDDCDDDANHQDPSAERHTALDAVQHAVKVRVLSPRQQVHMDPLDRWFHHGRYKPIYEANDTQK